MLTEYDIVYYIRVQGMDKALDLQNQGPEAFILIHWAFINQIIVGVLAGGNAHNRIWSCHMHQKSKLYIVPDILPDIVPDIEVLFNIIIINLQYWIFFINIKNNNFDIGPYIQIYPSLPLNIGPYIEYFLQYLAALRDEEESLFYQVKWTYPGEQRL